jgi:hypothetical protein
MLLRLILAGIWADRLPNAERLQEMERGARDRASESSRMSREEVPSLVFRALYSALHPVHVVVALDNNVMKGEACIGRLAAQEEQARKI